jgi:hypothetical protein
VIRSAAAANSGYGVSRVHRSVSRDTNCGAWRAKVECDLPAVGVADHVPRRLARGVSLAQSACDLSLLASNCGVDPGCDRGDCDLAVEQGEHAVPHCRTERRSVQ